MFQREYLSNDIVHDFHNSFNIFMLILYLFRTVHIYLGDTTQQINCKIQKQKINRILNHSLPHNISTMTQYDVTETKTKLNVPSKKFRRR